MLRNKNYIFIIFLIGFHYIKAQLEVFPIWHEKVESSTRKARLAANDTLKLPFTENFIDANTSINWKTNFGVIVNNNFAFNQPSINVATLDGINGVGTPYVYRPDKSLAAGIGDYLESKPIDLSGLSTSDGVGMNFFWQQGTLHDFNRSPLWRQGERLRLLFKDKENVYRQVWPSQDKINEILATYKSRDTFYLENIAIGEEYLYNGFQFKFEYNGTLVGNYGIFNIDNIWLDKNIVSNGVFKEPKDYAFSSKPSFLLKDYSSIPINHFLNQSEAVIDDTLSASMVTLDNLFITDSDSSIEVFHLNSKVKILSSGSSIFDFETLNRGKQAQINWDVNRSAIKNALNNLSLNEEHRILTKLSLVTPDSIRVTDSTSSITTLADYYSYDDGTLEAGLGVKDVGEFVQSFDILEDDTLSAFYIYFPRYGLNNEGTFINFRVFSALKDVDGATEDVLLKTIGGNVEANPDTNSLNKFIKISVGNSIQVKKGKLYLGIQQDFTNRILVGLDYSRNKANDIYYRLFEDPWFSFASNNGYGTMAIRPIMKSSKLSPQARKENLAFKFVPEEVEPVLEKSVFDLSEVAFFPNPAVDNVGFDMVMERIRLFDLQGFSIAEIGNEKTLSLQNLNSGVYILEYEKSGQTVSRKLVISPRK